MYQNELVAKFGERVPSIVWIEGLPITIEWRKGHDIDTGNAWGVMVGADQSIRLSYDIPSPEKMAVTLLHEIFHYITTYRQIEGPGKGVVDRSEETVVMQASSGLWEVLRANPWLPKWLHDIATCRHESYSPAVNPDKFVRDMVKKAGVDDKILASI
jgi:hypothetical protein